MTLRTEISSAKPRPSAGGVVSFDRERFDAACAELLQRASMRGAPDVLIGIPTGGLWVAEAMARSVDGAIPVLPLTCRRPSTAAKRRARRLLAPLAHLPRGLRDWLRIMEHRLLTAKPQPPAQPYVFDESECARLGAWLARSGERPVLLVVDDAVDSGATLLRVIAELRRLAPAGAVIRSAVVAVTTATPLIEPDYVLRRQLCRFPWSLDA
jgi:hypoxanthine phosphoribosyltransferase